MGLVSPRLFTVRFSFNSYSSTSCGMRTPAWDRGNRLYCRGTASSQALSRGRFVSCQATQFCKYWWYFLDGVLLVVFFGYGLSCRLSPLCQTEASSICHMLAIDDLYDYSRRRCTGWSSQQRPVARVKQGTRKCFCSKYVMVAWGHGNVARSSHGNLESSIEQL